MTMLEFPQWPAPDPVRGAALDRNQVSAALGWTGRSTLDVQLSRSRAGKQRAALFPEPAGYAIRTGRHWKGPADTQTRPRPVSYWWAEDIIAYRNAAASGTAHTTTTQEGDES